MLRLISDRLGCGAVFFGEPTVLLCIVAAVLSLRAHALCLLPVLLGRDVIVPHVASSHWMAQAHQPVPVLPEPTYSTAQGKGCAQRDIMRQEDDARSRRRPRRK